MPPMLAPEPTETYSIHYHDYRLYIAQRYGVETVIARCECGAEMDKPQIEYLVNGGREIGV